MASATTFRDMQDRLAEVEDLRRRRAFGVALSVCQVLIREWPHDPRPLLLAAAISLDNLEPDRALSFLDKASAIQPDRADIHCDRAQILRNKGDLAGTESAYDDALSAKPDLLVAHLALAKICEEADRWEEAAYHLQVAVAADPTNLDARERLAMLLDGFGQIRQAADLRRETIRRARQQAVLEYTRIRTPGAVPTARMAESGRLAWSRALLVFAKSGIGLAKFQEGQENPEAASTTYAATLALLTEAADQALSLETLQRAFATVTFAFSQCHYEMALLQERAGAVGGAIYHLEEALQTRSDSWGTASERLGEIVSSLGDTIGGVRETVVGYRGQDLPPAEYPATRWSFSPHAKDWLVPVIRHRHPAPAGKQRRIAILASGPRDIQISFALACILLSRGHTVDFLWLPALHFVHRCDPEPQYDAWDEMLVAREMAQFADLDLPRGLRVIDLRDIAPADLDEAMEAAADRLARLDVRVEAGDDATGEQFDTLRMNRMAANMNSMRRVAAYLSDTQVDHLVLRHGGLKEKGAALYVAQAVGVRAVTWETSPVDAGSITLSVNRSHADFDLSALWTADDPHHLTAARRERIIFWLSGEDGGDYRTIEPRRKHVPGTRANSLLTQLQIDASKPVVALFVDGIRPASATGGDRAFSTPVDWVVRTVAFFEAHPEWQLVVRIPSAAESRAEHPVALAVRSHWPQLPDNIRIMEEAPPSALYRLLDAAQLGLYYTDPIGLELAVRGIHALTPAAPFYSGLGFTDEAVAEEGYFQRIGQILDDPSGTAMTTRAIELAWCCADLYLNRTPLPFPWPYRRFWHAITEDWPMQRVLGEEGQARFDRVFAVLGGEVDPPDGVCGRLA